MNTSFCCLLVFLSLILGVFNQSVGLQNGLLRSGNLKVDTNNKIVTDESDKNPLKWNNSTANSNKSKGGDSTTQTLSDPIVFDPNTNNFTNTTTNYTKPGSNGTVKGSTGSAKTQTQTLSDPIVFDPNTNNFTNTTTNYTKPGSNGTVKGSSRIENPLIIEPIVKTSNVSDFGDKFNPESQEFNLYVDLRSAKPQQIKDILYYLHLNGIHFASGKTADNPAN